ncbi:MAG: RimK family alpha-L-glutamate ligase [Clostridia bacterium]|nr:RimK family alpha-L-glutamate ligase [Clostridia bacterium]
MKGWLIVNAFLRTQKLERLYAFLSSSAQKQSVSLELLTNVKAWEYLQNGTDFMTRMPDFVIFWDKDVRLAERLEGLGIRLFNSAAAVENCDDKQRTAFCLQRAGVPIPETLIAPKTFDNIGYTELSFLEVAEKRLGYPMVIKEAYGSFGAQVYLAQDKEQACSLIENLGRKPLLFQKYIAESRGKDIRVNVVGEKAVCAILRENAEDFRSNISGGGRATGIALDKGIADLAVSACQAVGADFAGVDILLGKDAPLVCEVNSNPHFESTLTATGVDLSEYVVAYIKEQLCAVG